MSTPNEDAEHLRLLSILYYVWAGLTAVFSCFGFFWIAVVFGFVATASQDAAGPPAAAIGGFMAIVGVLMIVIALASAAVSAFAGRSLAQRRNHTFCQVAAALACLSFPLGTALGVFTFIVLSRPSVKALFANNSQPTA
jgi:hypothetical protein